jgi:hypothetical protein
MRQFAAVLILLALFFVLIGSQFTASDGDKLRAISVLTLNKLRGAMPPAVNVAAPVDALRKELPTRPDDVVRARLAMDKRFVGVEFRVTAEGNTVILRGLVPDARIKRLAVGVAENTVGVESVVDELAMPAPE